MAFVRYQFCDKCAKETRHTNLHCNDCFSRENRNKIVTWEAQTIEEKLTDLRKRIEKLEQAPIKY